MSFSEPKIEDLFIDNEPTIYDQLLQEANGKIEILLITRHSGYTLEERSFISIVKKVIKELCCRRIIVLTDDVNSLKDFLPFLLAKNLPSSFAIANSDLSYLEKEQQIRLIANLADLTAKLEETKKINKQLNVICKAHSNVDVIPIPFTKHRLEHLNKYRKKSKLTFGEIEHIIRDTTAYSYWVQDPFLVAHKQEEIFLIEPFSFKRNSIDEEIANILEEKSTQSTKIEDLIIIQLQSYLQFEGGNVLTCDGFVLIGQDSIDKSISFLIEQGILSRNLEETVKNEKVIKLFGILFKGDKIIPIACSSCYTSALKGKVNTKIGDRQIFFHIDIFLTPLGRLDKEQSTYYIGIAKPYYPKSEKEKPYFFSILEDAFAEIENNIYAEFTANGINNVKLIPIILPLVRREGTTFDVWHIASYNNCLVENSSKTIWLPSYAETWGETSFYEKDVEAPFKELGYKNISFIGDFTSLMKKRGSLHCVLKCLKRSQLIH